MRRVILAIAGTVTGLLALLSFKTHSTATAAAAPPTVVSGTSSKASGPTATPSASSSDSSSPASTASTASSGSGTSGSTGSSAATAKTVTGTAVDTRYGPVQVQITVKSGKITAAQAVEYPQGGQRDEQINAYAVPVLNQETVAADSANIDAVSGATYTSGGYISSLQSAVDKAGL